jgi:hypothetical protein
LQFVYQVAGLALATSAGEFARTYLIAYTHIAPIWRPPLYVLAFAATLLIFASIGNWLQKRKPLETSQPKRETNQELALLSSLQVEALELRNALQGFLKSMPTIDRDLSGGTQEEKEARWRRAGYEQDCKVRASFELNFKSEAVRVYNRFVVEGIRDSHLGHLAWNAGSAESVQELADTLWKVAGQVKS